MKAPINKGKRMPKYEVSYLLRRDERRNGKTFSLLHSMHSTEYIRQLLLKDSLCYVARRPNNNTGKLNKLLLEGKRVLKAYQ